MSDIDIRHEITVKRLREVLGELQDDDLLIPNRVQNLLIVRGNESVGFIDLLHVEGRAVFYSEDE